MVLTMYNNGLVFSHLSINYVQNIFGFLALFWNSVLYVHVHVHTEMNVLTDEKKGNSYTVP